MRTAYCAVPTLLFKFLNKREQVPDAGQDFGFGHIIVHTNAADPVGQYESDPPARHFLIAPHRLEEGFRSNAGQVPIESDPDQEPELQ